MTLAFAAGVATNESSNRLQVDSEHLNPFEVADDDLIEPNPHSCLFP